MTSRLTLWTALLGALFCLQLGWWGYLLWNQGGELHRSEYARLQGARDAAQQHLERLAADEADAAASWAGVAALYPQLVHVPGATPSVQIGSDALAALDQTQSRWRVMILGEGSLFALLGLLGLYLFVRVARRESYLALQQSNFVHAVTHEFRSPLQSLRLAAESQLRRPDPEKTKAYSAGMLEDVDRLEGLVENMLTVGRLDADAFRSQTQPVDLSEHVATLCERLTAHSKLTTCDIAPDIRAEADASTLEPILRNLIENAHKYGDGSAIEIRLIADGAYALLTVADAGRGFTAADRRHLFERFWRAGDERVRTTRGAGLGLFLVQTLARAQGAQVDATSEGPGKGATFEVRWPLLMDGSSR